MLECILGAFAIAFGMAVAMTLSALLMVFIGSLIAGMPFGGLAGLQATLYMLLGIFLVTFVLEAALLILQCLVAGEPGTANASDGTEGQALKGEPATLPLAARYRPYVIGGVLAGVVILLRP